jgi:hypothetical protein
MSRHDEHMSDEAIEAMTEEVADEYRRTLTPGDDRVERLRARVEAAVHAEAQSTGLRRSVRWRNLVGHLPVAARIAAAVALVIAGIQIGRLSSARGRSEATIDAIADGELPIPSLTPGAIANVSASALCAPHQAEKPPIPADVRLAVLRAYRMEDVPARQYELDYLITPELGGVPDRRNLWPERYESGTWNAHLKDEIEDLLPRLVCDGRLNLATAQRDISTDWIAAYKKYFQTDRPLAAHTRLAADQDDDAVRPRSAARFTVRADARASVLRRNALLLDLRQHHGLQVVVLERD